MKLIKNILLTFLLIIGLFYAGATVYVKLYAKDTLTSALSSGFKQDVSIGQVHYQFPFGISAKTVTIGDLLKIDVLLAQLNPLAFAQKKYHITHLTFIRPSAVIEKTSDVPLIPEQTSPGAQKEISSQSSSQPELNFEISTFIIKDGRLDYTQTFAQPVDNNETPTALLSSPIKKLSINLKNIQSTARGLVYPPEARKTAFDFQAVLSAQESLFSGNIVKGSGWIDWLQRDMQGHIEVMQKDGQSNLIADIVSIKNDMQVKGRLAMKDFIKSEPAPLLQANETAPVNQLVVETLSSMGMDIGTDFSFSTKMDNFRFDRISFRGSVATR